MSLHEVDKIPFIIRPAPQEDTRAGFEWAKELVRIRNPSFKDKVFRIAKRLLVSSEEAEDATQELFLKLWRNKEKLSSYRNTEAFAMTMTKNYCYDRLKSKQANNLKLIHINCN